MNMLELYNSNDNFKKFVDKFARDNNKTLDESFETVIVKEYAKCTLTPTEKNDWVLGK